MIQFRSNVGRLGNQLFVYAFATACHVELNQSYYLSDISYLHKYFRLTLFEKIINWLKGQWYFRVARFISPPVSLDFTDLTLIHPWKQTLSSGNFNVTGYFQSETYFDQVRDQVKSRLVIRSSHRKNFYETLVKLNLTTSRLVVIHVRRTDYENLSIPSLGIDFRLPFAYYKQALKQVDDNAKYVVIGDDRIFMEEKFGFLPGVIISRESEIVDFQFLLNAHVAIISNSTFAWWGAYLNQVAGKRIIAPRNFLGFKENKDFPIDIYPDGWQIIDF